MQELFNFVKSNKNVTCLIGGLTNTIYLKIEFKNSIYEIDINQDAKIAFIRHIGKNKGSVYTPFVEFAFNDIVQELEELNNWGLIYY